MQMNWILSFADQEMVFGNEHSDILKNVANQAFTSMLPKKYNHIINIDQMLY